MPRTKRKYCTKEVQMYNLSVVYSVIVINVTSNVLHKLIKHFSDIRLHYNFHDHHLQQMFVHTTNIQTTSLNIELTRNVSRKRIMFC